MSATIPVCACIETEDQRQTLLAIGQSAAVNCIHQTTEMGLCQTAQREVLKGLLVVWARNICGEADPLVFLDKLMEETRQEAEVHYPDSRLCAYELNDDGSVTELSPVDRKDMN